MGGLQLLLEPSELSLQADGLLICEGMETCLFTKNALPLQSGSSSDMGCTRQP